MRDEVKDGTRISNGVADKIIFISEMIALSLMAKLLIITSGMSVA
jgi:hypothetical protein